MDLRIGRFIGAFMVVLSPFSVSGDMSKIMPPDNIVKGWKSEKDHYCFDGSVSSARELYALIDGDADVYIKRGFVSASFKGYKNDLGEYICFQIYNQKNGTHAREVFDFYGTMTIDPLSITLGDVARKDTSALSTTVWEVVRQGYFMRVLAPKNSFADSVVNVLILKALSAIKPENGKP
ncbi:MAG: hypothetical protein JW795_16100 [Chitinivibrionales bacterium]|nr:hypothetical protein [Chitinivibrionales bacterium]